MESTKASEKLLKIDNFHFTSWRGISELLRRLMEDGYLPEERPDYG